MSSSTPDSTAGTAAATSDAPAEKVHDVLIVGSGPAGYTAAIYTARANLHPIVLTGAVTAGGSLMNTTEVENFPGFRDGIMGPALMEEMRAQAERFGATLIADDVVKVELDGNDVTGDGIKTATDSEGRVWRARSVILATGSSYRKLGLDGEDRLSGRGVSWCATCDGFFFRGHTIAVVGGGDSAVEEATFLSRFAERVYLIHRRGELRASKIMQDRLYADAKIVPVLDSAVTEIHGEESLEGVTVADLLTGNEKRLDVTGLFVAIGHDPRSELFATSHGGPVFVDREGYVEIAGTGAEAQTATNVDGVFACGDLVDHTYRQAITAAGSGCQAALDAERWLAARG